MIDESTLKFIIHVLSLCIVIYPILKLLCDMLAYNLEKMFEEDEERSEN